MEAVASLEPSSTTIISCGSPRASAPLRMAETHRPTQASSLCAGTMNEIICEQVWTYARPHWGRVVVGIILPFLILCPIVCSLVNYQGGRVTETRREIALTFTVAPISPSK